MRPARPLADSNFEIVGNEVRVKPSADLDYETATTHELYVTAADTFETSAPTQITVTVTDVAEDLQLDDGGVTFADSAITENSITGGTGNDTITGTTGNDTLLGGAGDDVLVDGGAGTDSFDGGEGSDTIRLNDSDGAKTNTVTDSGGSGVDRIELATGGGTYRIQGDFSASSGIEVIDGSGASGDQLGTRDGSANFDFTDVTLIGVDEIIGTTGADTIIGSAGDDVIVDGGAGTDSFDGGEGSDTIRLNDSDGGKTNTVTDSGGSGVDRIELATGGGTYRIQGDFSASSGIEVVDGSDASGDQLGTKDGSANFDFTDVTLIGVDEIIGTNSADNIIGSTGDDTISLNRGNDTAAGGGGDDTLHGAKGNDTLYGGTGNDTLHGGVGHDTMYGEAGADTFEIAAAEGSDVVDGGSGGGWTDVVDLQGMGSGAVVSGNTVDGDGWTMVLDSGSSVVGQTGDQLDLSSDAAGVITFDDGGTVDFAAVERVTW